MSRVPECAMSQAKYAVEAYNMKTTKSRSCSITTTFLSVLLAAVLVATGCAPKANPEPVADELFAAIMPTVKKTPEYAKIMKRYGAAMKRLDEAADPSKVDSVTYRDAYQGRIQLDGLCDLLAPKYVVPPADGARCVNVVFMASGYLRSELVTIVRLIPLGSGFGVTDFIIGDTKGE